MKVVNSVVPARIAYHTALNVITASISNFYFKQYIQYQLLHSTCFSCTVYDFCAVIMFTMVLICNKKAVLSQRRHGEARYISGSNEPLRRYGHSKLSKMAACHQLGFDVTGNSAIWSADPENPTLEPNMKCTIGSPVAEIWPFACLGGTWNPHFGGRGGRRGSAMAPFERAMVASL